ncbi:MAG: CoA-binding protein [Dehalococcoidales bacterium]|nr:CoA-binding protein [Dehalococcoidales bacterium]
MSLPELAQILNPRSVAVIGASANTSSFGYSYVHHLVEYGFKGKIYPVNPNYTEIMGLKTYQNVSAIPGEVDYAISCVNAGQVMPMLAELAAKNTHLVHLYTARFSETGRKDAAELEQAVLKFAQSRNIRLIGPNCMGLYYPRLGISFGYNLPKDAGTVGMASQSGGGASGFAHIGGLRGLRFSKVFSYGNALDLNECDYLDYFINDPETKIICLYVEGVKDGRRFFETLKRATKIKPVVVIKGGRGQSGARMTSSHTASLAGKYQVFEALVKQCGAISAGDFEEMADIVVALHYLPPIKGNRVGVIGGGGGPSVMAAEACETAGLDVIPIPQSLREEMKSRGVTIWDWVSNPVDLSIIGGSGISDLDMLHLMGKHPDFDLLLVNFNEWVMFTLATDERLKGMPLAVKGYSAIKEKYGKPLAVVLGERGLVAEEYDDFKWKTLAQVRSDLRKAGIPVFSTFPRAATALHKVWKYYSGLNS